MKNDNELSEESYREEKDTHPRMDTDVVSARILTDVLISQKVGGMIISPGSRNTPLIVAASARENLKKWIVPDERSAAFMALGMAMVKKVPFALVCTSGTALYNYAPAVAEAYYQQVPLIVISADRPSEWIDQDDSQTLVQPGALSNIVKKSFNIPVVSATDNDKQWFVERVVNEAILLSMANTPGPVHINIQFSEPLGGTVRYSEQKVRKIEVIENSSPLPRHIMDMLGAELADKRIMLTAGFLPSSEKLQKAVSNLSRLGNVTIMAETLSNLHLHQEAYSIDLPITMLEEEESTTLRPDIVISIGGALVSRMLKTYLRKVKPQEHWTLGDTKIGTDTFQALTRHYEVEPAAFISALAGSIGHHRRKRGLQESEFKKGWTNLKEKAQRRHAKYVESSGWSELKALDDIFTRIPNDRNVFLSNGTVVRYAQLSTRRLPHLTLGCRGVSGIDGTNYAALGASLAYGGRTILVTGDLSFSYAPEIISSAYMTNKLSIIVINNGGGGIFRFVKSTKHLEIREKYFCAPPHLELQRLCESAGLPYYMANEERYIKEKFETFLQTGGLFEIKVNPEESAEILNNYFILK
ncbi:MAG: 2-succinyl-5-enolpyruvyl-6-hydroxy-3-cyclohexene-1-carboxylic-acid synthase [Bacteroidales bacterium]|nr:2-succinyl-5-enolpyruvyl-6-hydroxy-3-cyclohexene-1-carboxylic-acid synthase [Bacteroidales bacterium]